MPYCNCNIKKKILKLLFLINKDRKKHCFNEKNSMNKFCFCFFLLHMCTKFWLPRGNNIKTKGLNFWHKNIKNYYFICLFPSNIKSTWTNVFISTFFISVYIFTNLETIMKSFDNCFDYLNFNRMFWKITRKQHSKLNNHFNIKNRMIRWNQLFLIRSERLLNLTLVFCTVDFCTENVF